jgi:plasmid stabilization system protein ParE
MSEWNVSLSEQAEADLLGIYEYIAFTLFEPETAPKLLQNTQQR